jgi:hypothetical protein
VELSGNFITTLSPLNIARSIGHALAVIVYVSILSGFLEFAKTIRSGVLNRLSGMHLLDCPLLNRHRM